jgi:hypothetical protein
VEAHEPLLLRSFTASRPPSELRIWDAWPGYKGAIILRVIEFWCPPPCTKFVDESCPSKSIVRARCEPRAGGGSGLRALGMCFTSTHSGSGLGVKGLLGRFGLGKWSLDGGCTRALAGRPCEDEYASYNRNEDESTVVEPPLPPIGACGW